MSSFFLLLFNSVLAIARKALRLVPSIEHFQPLSEGCMTGRSKRLTFSPLSSSTGIANPHNSKSKWALRFPFITLTHEDPGCSFCPSNFRYALAAVRLKATCRGPEMHIGRNRLFSFATAFPQTQAVRCPATGRKLSCGKTLYKVYALW